MPPTWPSVEAGLDWLERQDVLTDNQVRTLARGLDGQIRIDFDDASALFQERLRVELQQSFAAGESRTQWRARVANMVPGLLSHAETIGRTYTHRAFHEGLATVMKSPSVADEFPYFEYAATGDSRTRKAHADMDGKVAHRDSPLAAEMQKLIASYNCRCTMIPMSREDAVAKGIDDNTGWVEPIVEPEPVQQQPEPIVEPAAPPPTPITVPTPIVKALPKKAARKTPADDKPVTIYKGVLGFDGQARAERIPNKPSTEKKPAAEKYRVVQKLGGSTGAEKVVDAKGKQFVRKFGASAEHVKEEFAAENLYRAAGVAVPESRLEKQDGKPVKLSEFITARPLGVLAGEDRKKAEAAVRKHFAADALFGNWDVLGQSGDNVLVTPDGEVHRVDVGGSLRFRAQGGEKTFGDFPDELTTLRNPERSAARIFKQITDQELVDQIDKLTGKRKAILAAAPKDLRKTLAKRIDYMDQIADVLRKPADASRARDGNEIQRIQDGTKVRKRLGSITPNEGKALTQYTGDLYEDINKALREDPDRTTFPEPSIDIDDDGLSLDKMNVELQKVITRGEELPKPVIVYRGRKNLAVADDMEKAMHVGETIEWNGYGSTSLDPTIASTFGPLIYEISITKGLDVASLQGFQGLNLSHKDRESEILVNHRSRYKVIGIKRNVPGRLIDDGRPTVTIIQMVQIND